VQEPASPRLIQQRCRDVARGCAASSSFIAALTLLGWQFDVPALRSVVPGLVAMNPLTAVCFLLSGFALAVNAGQFTERVRLLGHVAAIAVSACGFVVVTRYIAQVSIPIDAWLFASKLDGVGPLPNRMAPNTALNFSLLGTALLIFRVELRRFRPALALCLLVALGAIITLVGYTYSVGSMTRYGAFIPMALHTAFCFLLLSAGVVLSAPDADFMRQATSSGTGGKLLRRLVPAFVVVPILLGWARLVGEQAGLYGTAFGTAMMVGANIVMGVTLAWTAALALDRAEELRRGKDEIVTQLAYYDALTGLPNRTLFADRLSQALARSNRHGGLVAVMFVDLDGFKAVNDRFGHSGGDALLASVATRLRACMRPTDTPARLAGDEFTVVLTDVRARGDIEIVARRLVSAISEPHELASGTARVSASIGICVAPDDGGDLATLLQNADHAMYAAKAAGKNCFEFYRADMTPVAR
jgi:diguanylate cyclase (GGDEF)-like protein